MAAPSAFAQAKESHSLKPVSETVRASRKGLKAQPVLRLCLILLDQ